MPQLRKVALSQFIRTECLRQLRLNLSPTTRAFFEERRTEDMPPKQPPRPGFEHLMREGDEWQTAKILDLTETFGQEMVIGNRVVVAPNRISYRPIDLIDVLPQAFLGVFLIEAEFEVGDAFELDLGVQSDRY